MLGSFVARGLTQEQAECEIAASIIAGSDTTATAIRSTMLYIMTNPRVLSSLQHEIQSSLPAAPPTLSSPPITITPYTHLRTMPYLQAVIKEGLRMHPPAASPMSKQVPPDGDNWNGIAFPPGTRISLCLWGVFRSRALWGNDADEFRPERWLEVGPEKRAEMDAVWDVLFSAGKWACLGRNVAHIEMSKTIVEVCHVPFDGLFATARRDEDTREKEKGGYLGGAEGDVKNDPVLMRSSSAIETV
ncbi:hypothetical protein E4U58_005265 [Claviceps cyperi]|nr:hypothetical protein E4U58_005265 [Claviceps cyperi]